MKEKDIRDPAALARYLELVRQDIAVYFTDPDGFASVSCPACGGGRHAQEFVKDGFRYVSCAACSTLFANPRPTADRLKRFYLDAPSSRYWIDGFFRPVAENRRALIFRPRADYVAGRLGVSRGCIGDIGAGFGLFLEELRKHWPDAELMAIEPSAEMAAICRSRGIGVVQAAVEDLAGLPARFDLLTAFELIEHLHEPRRLIEEAFRLLRPGGWFLATTLSARGFDIQILWEGSNSVSPPHHLNFLTPEALAGLCVAAGFTVEEVSTPGELDWDLVERAILKDGAQTDRFWRWLAQHGDAAAKRDLQQWVARHGLSSHMRILTRKP